MKKLLIASLLGLVGCGNTYHIYEAQGATTVPPAPAPVESVKIEPVVLGNSELIEIESEVVDMPDEIEYYEEVERTPVMEVRKLLPPSRYSVGFGSVSHSVGKISVDVDSAMSNIKMPATTEWGGLR